MSSMHAIDTNIVIYRFDRRDLSKQRVARKLIAQLQARQDTILPWQALAEFGKYLNELRRQKQIDRPLAIQILRSVQSVFDVVAPPLDSIDRAFELSERHSLSHWDSMLLAACEVAGVDTLYTEDMGAPRQIEGIALVNPFKP